MSEEPQPTTEVRLSAYDGGPLGAGIDWADPNSKLAPYYLTAGGVTAAAVLGLTLFALALAPLWHTDFWVHLKYGEWIAANRSLPGVEPLSDFTDKQKPMFDAMWLTQVGYHALFRAGESLAAGDAQRRFEGGVELVRLAHLLAAIAVVGFVGLACRRVADSVPWATGAMLFLLAAMLSPLTVQRPQLFGLACFAALLCGLSRPAPSRAGVGWIPALMVLWANLHGSFVVGFGLLGLFLLGRAIEVFRDGGRSALAVWRDAPLRRLLLVLGASVAAVAVLNPYGPTLYLNVVRFGGHPNLQTLAEWTPLDFSQRQGGHWLYLAAALLLAATQVASPRPFSPVQVLLILTLGLWPLFQQRAMAWWLPVVPWIAAPHWVAAADRWGLRLPESVPNFRRTVFAALVILLAVIASPASAWLKSGSPRPARASLHPGTPDGVAAALRGEAPADPERVQALARVVREWHGGRYAGRVFASEIQGEYLLRSLPADAPVMLFNHAQLFAPGYWSDCLRVEAGGLGWWEFLDRHRAGVVVVEADLHPALCQELRGSRHWEVVVDEARAPARDAYSRLFVAVRKPEALVVPLAPPPHEKKGGAGHEF